MKIAVVGAGAVGSFYGGLLARAGLDVHFVTRGAQGSAVGTVDIVLVCVKAHQTAEILDQLAPLIGAYTTIVPMQNGIETDEVLAARCGRERVCAAVVYVGATAIEPGVTVHVANGSILIGAPTGFDAARLLAVRDVLSAGFPVKLSRDIQRDRWYKLVWNATINPLTAIAGRTPYQLVTQPDTRAHLLGIMREVMAVGRAHGIDLTEQAAHDYFAWIEKTPDIRTSMQFHRERGLSLETDALVGVVVRKGRERGVPTPLCESLVAALNAIEGV
jgi:2-dehydropantoate 2-reductase